VFGGQQENITAMGMVSRCTLFPEFRESLLDIQPGQVAFPE